MAKSKSGRAAALAKEQEIAEPWRKAQYSEPRDAGREWARTRGLADLIHEGADLLLLLGHCIGECLIGFLARSFFVPLL
jgi:hypothetical protein